MTAAPNPLQGSEYPLDLESIRISEVLRSGEMSKDGGAMAAFDPSNNAIPIQCFGNDILVEFQRFADLKKAVVL